MIDFTKPVQTRNGREVVIYCTDAPSEFCVHGRVEGVGGAFSWQADGRYCDNPTHANDLVNAPAPKRVLYVTVHDDGSTVCYVHLNGIVKASAHPRRIAHVRVEYEEGQFDD